MTSGSGVQVDDGEFTRLHNTILDKLALARLAASEYRCLMFLFRMTYGWQKKEDVISLSQWCKGTGIDTDKRHNALRTLNGLVAKRVIYCKSNGNNRAATWGFNKHFDQWDASLFVETVIDSDNSFDAENNTSVITPHNTSVISPDNSTVIKPHNTSVITGDNHKRNRKKELKKVKEKPRAKSRSGAAHPMTQPIMDAYLEALGYQPGNYGQEVAAAKTLAKQGREPVDITAAYALLKAQPFWQSKHLSLQTLVKEIPALKQAHLNGVPQARAPTNGNGHMSKGEKQQAEVDRAFAILEGHHP